MTFIKTFFAILIPFLVLDVLWLSTIGKTVYPKYIGHILGDHMVWIPVIAFYILYAIGLLVFVVNPALRIDSTLIQVFLAGALFGLVAYGTYDFTNHATLREWKTIVTILDLIWGATASGVASLVAYLIVK